MLIDKDTPRERTFRSYNLNFIFHATRTHIFVCYASCVYSCITIRRASNGKAAAVRSLHVANVPGIIIIIAAAAAAAVVINHRMPPPAPTFSAESARTHARTHARTQACMPTRTHIAHFIPMPRTTAEKTFLHLAPPRAPLRTHPQARLTPEQGLSTRRAHGRRTRRFATDLVARFPRVAAPYGRALVAAPRKNAELNPRTSHGHRGVRRGNV